jgi:HlyD family secretion protein
MFTTQKNPAPRHAPIPTHPNRHQLGGAGSKLLILLVVLAILAGGGYFAAKRWMPAKSQDAKTQVVTTNVTRGSVERSVESSGSISANLSVDIKCRASGEIIELPFDISDVVKKGQLLCQLDPTDEKLNVQSQETAVAQSKAKLVQAQIALEKAQLNLKTTRDKVTAALESAKVKASAANAKLARQKQLHETNLTSLEDLQDAESDAADAIASLEAAQVAVNELSQQELDLETYRQDVELNQAQLKAQEISLSSQKQQLSYTTVNAPIDGVVSSLDVQKGTIVASGTNNVSGGTTIMTLMDLSRIFFNATVDESDIGGVKVGQDARLVVDSFPDKTFKGKVVRVAVEGVEESNVVTFEVKVEVIDEEKSLLKPEMTGTVTIVMQYKDDALVIPIAALKRRGEQVYVNMPNGEKRNIITGIQGLNIIEVTSGLSENESILVDSDDTSSKWQNSSDNPPPPML